MLVLETRSARAAFVPPDLGRRLSGLSRRLRCELDSPFTGFVLRGGHRSDDAVTELTALAAQRFPTTIATYEGLQLEI